MWIKRKYNGFRRVVNQQGLVKYFIGHIKLPYYRKLQRKYHFDMWHITPYELRPYAVTIVDYLNRCGGKCICEIGCGLGDIIRNVNSKLKFGFDISASAISCAEYLDSKTRYFVGSFEEAAMINMNRIDYLITVNFTHGISPEELKKSYSSIISQKDVRNIIVDSVDGEVYPFFHNYDEILPNYSIKRKIFDYNGRKVWLLRKGMSGII